VVALLDMQGMTPASSKGGGHGNDVESGFSVALCFSFASVVLCID
jgi:SapB morphogen precursor RamS